MPAPAFISEGVAARPGAGEIQPGEPAAAGRALQVGLQVAEGPEVTPDVVEDGVQHQAHASALQLAGKGRQGLVGAQAPVHLVIIDRVVAVRAGLEERAEVKRVGPQALDMIQPGVERIQALDRRGLKVIAPRRGAQPERVDMIEERVLRPG